MARRESDHDLLISIKVGQEYVKERLLAGASRMEALEKRQDEIIDGVNKALKHLEESRIRPLEKQVWGKAALTGGGAAGIVGVLIYFLQNWMG